MPRRSGWFLTVETERGKVQQPVENQRAVRQFVALLAPVIPHDSTWYLEWVP